MSQEPHRMLGLVPYLALAVMLSAAVTPAASARAADAAGADQAQPTAAKVEAEPYLVEISASRSYEVGATGSVKVSLTAKPGFHINDQYPYRFKTSPPAAGVSYPKRVLERADGKFEETTAVFELPLVATQAGQFAVGGVLSLSVCNASSCIVQKAPLDVTITVN